MNKREQEAEILKLIENEKDLPKEGKELLKMLLKASMDDSMTEEEFDREVGKKLKEVTGVDEKDAHRLEVNYSMMLSLADKELDIWQQQVKFNRMRDESQLKMVAKIKLELLNYLFVLDFTSYKKTKGFYKPEQIKAANIPFMDFVTYFMQLLSTHQDIFAEMDLINILRVKNETISIPDEGIFKHMDTDAIFYIFEPELNGRKDLRKKRIMAITKIMCYIVDEVERTIGKEFFQWLKEDYYIHQAWKIGKVSGEIESDYDPDNNKNHPVVKKIMSEVNRMLDSKL